MPRCILVLFLLLAACATEEEIRAEIRAAVSDPYIGQSFDNFVIARGPPESEFKLEDEGTIYTWSSGKRIIKESELEDTNGDVIEVTVDREVECRLQIHADKTGIVESIEITRDPPGEWHSSWCYETFR